MSLKKDDEKFKIILDSIYGNFENYSVSNYGRIKNNNNGKILKPKITDEGYMNFQITINKKSVNIPIHRLVCEFFNNKTNILNCVVNHINEIKNDNYYKNLEWVSVEKNNQHSKNISINMLDDNKSIIKTFNSYTDAFKYIGKQYCGDISKAIKSQRKRYGYYWSLN